MNGEIVTDDEDEVTLAEITSDFSQQTETRESALRFSKQLTLPVDKRQSVSQAP